MILPYCKFYFRDWIADLELRQCSPIARAIWMDMFCLMGMNSSRHGFLESKSGAGMTASELARLSCNTIEDVTAAIAELEQAGVFSRDERGVIFSRRMVKDRAKHDARRLAGASGGRATQERAQAYAATFAQADARAKSVADGQARFDADASSSAQAQSPEPTVQNTGEETNAANTVRESPVPENWQLAPAFEALKRTGKFANLTPELLAMVDRNYPRARLADNFSEIVEAARSLPGAIGEPHGWLNKKLSQIESRLQRVDSPRLPGSPRTRARSVRPELGATERLVIL